jgi:hypothetical protein
LAALRSRRSRTAFSRLCFAIVVFFFDFEAMHWSLLVGSGFGRLVMSAARPPCHSRVGGRAARELRRSAGVTPAGVELAIQRRATQLRTLTHVTGRGARHRESSVLGDPAVHAWTESTDLRRGEESIRGRNAPCASSLAGGTSSNVSETSANRVIPSARLGQSKDGRLTDPPQRLDWRITRCGEDADKPKTNVTFPQAKALGRGGIRLQAHSGRAPSFTSRQ